MSRLSNLINAYEKDVADKYFKPESNKTYPFRILNASDMLYGSEVWYDLEVIGDDGKPKTVRKVKRFLPENNHIAMTWLKDGETLKRFLAMHIYSVKHDDCFIYSPTQKTIIKSIIDVAKEVGEERLHEVTFLFKKEGEGKTAKYTLSPVLNVNGDIDFSPVPKEALSKANANPVNMLALLFGDRPWNNDMQYDLDLLDQSAFVSVAVVSQLPVHARRSKSPKMEVAHAL